MCIRLPTPEKLVLSDLPTEGAKTVRVHQPRQVTSQAVLDLKIQDENSEQQIFNGQRDESMHKRKITRMTDKLRKPLLQ